MLTLEPRSSWLLWAQQWASKRSIARQGGPAFHRRPHSVGHIPFALPLLRRLLYSGFSFRSFYSSPFWHDRNVWMILYVRLYTCLVARPLLLLLLFLLLFRYNPLGVVLSRPVCYFPLTKIKSLFGSCLGKLEICLLAWFWIRWICLRLLTTSLLYSVWSTTWGR